MMTVAEHASGPTVGDSPSSSHSLSMLSASDPLVPRPVLSTSLTAARHRCCCAGTMRPSRSATPPVLLLLIVALLIHALTPLAIANHVAPATVSAASPPLFVRGPRGHVALRSHLLHARTPARTARHLLAAMTPPLPPPSDAPDATGAFESLGAQAMLAAHPHIFATIVCSDDMEPGATVLHESLLSAAHRHPLLVLCSDAVSNAVRARLAGLPLVRIFRASGGPHTLCPNRTPSSSCHHLKLLLFSLPHAHKVIFLEHDTVVLSNIDDLANSPPFSGVREPHVGLFETSVMVLKPDPQVFAVLRDEFCSGEHSDHHVIRTAVPDEAWTDVSDSYNVPQEHMDALWYRRVATEPHILHYKGKAKPWNWWQVGEGGPLSADAFNRWCRVAKHTEFACGAGDEEMTPPMQPAGFSDRNRFTVLLSTYHRPTWKDLTRHYTSFKAVSQVILIWHDPFGDPPLAQQLGLKVVVWQPKRDSLNNRFFAPGNISEAVYVCDDDMKVTETQLIRAFQIWRGHTHRLVGFFPRRWMMTSPYYTARIRDGYNVVLTKGLFTHRYFLYLYSHLLPMRIRNVVDKYKNCEDILFNMMVSGFNGAAPLHILTEGTIVDMGHGEGISSRGAHFATRYKCVRHFIRELGIRNAPLFIGSYSEKPLKNQERE